MRKEIIVMAPLFGALFILTVIFKPVFFVISLFVILIWFVLARGNGYLIFSYLALLLSIGLFLGFYPEDKSDPNILIKDQAKTLAAAEFNTSNLTVSQLPGGRGQDGVYLVAPNMDKINKVVLTRPSQKEFQTYLISDINQQLKESGRKDIPEYMVGNRIQETLMLNQFGDKYPLRYAFTFLIALLPLVLIAALPKRIKSKTGYLFDTEDGKLKNWFLPKGPSQDVGAITGSAPIQLILVILIAFLIGTSPF